MSDDLTPLSAEELAAEGGTALPDKEVMSLLDLNANLDLALDAAAPIDLAVGANVLSLGSTAGAETVQGAAIHQGIVGDATATADQNSGITQGAGTTPTDGTQPVADTGTGGTSVATPGDALDGNLLNVNVNLNGDLNLAAPIDGAVAANANVAAPIDAAVAANIGSDHAVAQALAPQQVNISQHLDGVEANAHAEQDATVDQQ